MSGDEDPTQLLTRIVGNEAGLEMHMSRLYRLPRGLRTGARTSFSGSGGSSGSTGAFAAAFGAI